jgi:hypothetical protein
MFTLYGNKFASELMSAKNVKFRLTIPINHKANYTFDIPKEVP